MGKPTLKVKGKHGGPRAPSPTLPKPGLAPPAEPTWGSCLPPPAPALGSLVDADLFHLGNQHLEQPHDGLQRQL